MHTVPSNPTIIAIAWALTSTDTLVECRDNPTLAKCGEYVAMVIPGFGEFKALKGLEDFKYIKRVVEGTRLGKIGQLGEIALKEGKPLGKEGAPLVHEVTQDELDQVANGIREKFGAPDRVTEVPGKGSVETWNFDGGNVNYRNFSGTAGAGDTTIDFTKDLIKELGLKRYHVPRG